MKGLMKRLAALDGGRSRLIVAKLPANADLPALLEAQGITVRPDDMLVRLNRPDGVGEDFAHVYA